MIDRFNGNVVPFADDATLTNRTVFGGTTQSDDIDDNLNADFKKGWEIVGLNDNPTREDFNAMGYTLGALTAYLYEMGISEWNASQKYRVNSRVIGSDGKIYKALTGTIGTPNVNHNPTSDAVNWVSENITDYSTLTAKTTPVDADLFALGDSTSGFSLKKLTWGNIKTALNLLYIGLTGNQAIAGVKTFSSSPIAPTLPAQDNSTKVATTAYVDGKFKIGTAVASTSVTSIDFTGIPSWAKRITVMFSGVSTSGTSIPLIQLGTSSGMEVSSYLGAGWTDNIAPALNHSSGFLLACSHAATTIFHGKMELCYMGSNIWTESARNALSNSNILLSSAGSKTLSGVLDRIRITTVNGTDTFDAGQINIMYEG